MQQLRARITQYLQSYFPELGDSIREFHGSDVQPGQMPHKASGILVCIAGFTENEGPEIPWEYELSYSLIITRTDASALERDREGWDLASKVSAKVYRNCWGYQTMMELTPAKIRSGTKHELRAPDGTFTGINYWIINFSHLSHLEVAIGLK